MQTETDARSLRGLYAVTDAREPKPQAIAHGVQQALQGGARIIQYRDKSADHARRQQTASELRRLTADFGALLIINDDLALATECNADGVHLGRDDGDIRAARIRLGAQAIIGASCYNRLENAHAALAAGADYVAFGRFFPSRSKPGAVPAERELLRRAKQELDTPIAAIGGITADNAASLLAAGADMLAVVDGLFAQADVEAAARRLSALFADMQP